MEGILAGGVIFYILLILAPLMIWVNTSIIISRLSKHLALAKEQNLYLKLLVKQANPNLKLPGDKDA